MIKRAALVIVIKESKILSVSRGIGSSLWALPGGKAEYDESPYQNAARELYEETALTAQSLELVHEDLVPGEKGKGIDFYSTCFFATEWSGKPCHSDEGDLDWLSVEELTQTKSAFPLWSQVCIKMFMQKYPNIALS